MDHDVGDLDVLPEITGRVLPSEESAADAIFNQKAIQFSSNALELQNRSKLTDPR